MKDLNVILIQSALHWENKEKNIAMFEEKIASISQTIDLIILPEMFTTGFTMNASAMAEEMDGKSFQWMQKIAKEKNCVITGSIIIADQGKYYNRLIWMTPDGFEYYDKRHLFAYGEEDKTYSAGNTKFITTINGWNILPLICYDLRFPVWSRRTKKYDYDLLIYVANWPQRRSYAWKQLLIARAIENQSYVAGVNRVGDDRNNIFHSGDSAFIDYKGEIIKQVSDGKEEIITSTFSYKELTDFRKQFAFQNDADGFEIL